MHLDLVLILIHIYHLGDTPVVDTVFGIDVGIELVVLLIVIVLCENKFIIHLIQDILLLLSNI